MKIDYFKNAIKEYVHRSWHQPVDHLFEENEKMRIALKKIADKYNWYDGQWVGPTSPDDIARAALQQKESE